MHAAMFRIGLQKGVFSAASLYIIKERKGEEKEEGWEERRQRQGGRKRGARQRKSQSKRKHWMGVEMGVVVGNSFVVFKSRMYINN
jgi:hypothetical protein